MPKHKPLPPRAKATPGASIKQTPLNTKPPAYDKRGKLKKQQQFLAKLAEYASVKRACRVTNISTSLVYEWLKTDAAFKQKYTVACRAALQTLEDEAVRRAFEGTPKPIYHQGKKIGATREFSDTLLTALIKARALGGLAGGPAFADTATNPAAEKPKAPTVIKWGEWEITI